MSLTLQEFKSPGVIVFTGHLTDAPERTAPRFPESKVAAVRGAIARYLDEHRVSYGFSSAARGADLIFIKELLQRGGRVHVMLPFPPDAFRQTSISTTDKNPTWEAEFNELLRTASTDGPVRVEVLSQELPPEAERGAAYAQCNLRLQEAAIARARLLDQKARLLAVWNGKPGDGPGGASDAVRAWTSAGNDEPDVIDLSKL